MGQIPSTESRLHLLPIYSRTFAQSPKSDDLDELFLHGYGDSDEDVCMPPGTTKLETEIPEDDDYPIEGLHADIGVTSHFQTQRPAEESVISNILGLAAEPNSVTEMSESHASTRSMYDSRYKPLIVSPSECTEFREILKRCYAHESDILDCDAQIGDYAGCARAAVTRRLVK